MTHTLSASLVALGAFASGLLVAQNIPRAAAAAPPIAPIVVDVAGLTADDLPAPPGGTTHSKAYVDADGMTLSVYIGATKKHYHNHANEFQYIVKGTGTEWFGKKRIAIRPGMLLIIPKGMAHGGVPNGVTILGMKTPPQEPSDNHRIP